jgi:ElaB/YqjD/DUF883 family membrane-anchored ribosome-binding protein
MRHATLSLLVALSLSAPLLHAQEDAPPTLEPVPPAVQPAAETEQPASAPTPPRANDEREQATAQLARLRQENQRLRSQLQEELTKAPSALLTDEQQWFAVGGGVGVLGFLLGVLVSRGRRRRQWLN